MIPIARPELPDFDTYVERLRAVWHSRTLSNFGPFAQQMEAKARDYLGNPHVHAVASCDVGLVLAIAALGLPEESEVLVPSFTFSSTVNAIRWNGLRPVFCDVDPETFCISPLEVQARLTPAVRLVVGVHVFGNPCDMDAIRAVTEPAGVPVIYDAAHAYGSLYRGRKVGTAGETAVFSLSGTKVVTSGEGGLVASASMELASRLAYLRGYGFIGDYDTRIVGLNGKISELNAALGSLSLDTVEDAVAARTRIATRYRELLGDLEEIGFQRVPEDCRSSYKDFAIVYEGDPEGLAAELERAGVQTKRYFLPVHRHRAYRSFQTHPLPWTEWLYERVLCLPIFNELSLDLVDDICQIVRDYVIRARGGAARAA